MKMILGANESVPTSDPSFKGPYESLGKVGETGIPTSLASSLHNPTNIQEKASDADQASAKSTNGAKRSGRWTLDEKILFLYGLRRFGKGRWKKISIYLPDRYVFSWNLGKFSRGETSPKLTLKSCCFHQYL